MPPVPKDSAPVAHRASTSSTRGQNRNFSLPTLLCPGSPTSASACRPAVSPSSSIVGLKTSPHRPPDASRVLPTAPRKIRANREAIAVGNPLGSEGALCGVASRCPGSLVGCARRSGSTMAEGRRYAIAPQLGERTQPSSWGVWWKSAGWGGFGGWVGSTHRSFSFGLFRVSHVSGHVIRRAGGDAGGGLAASRAWFRESLRSWWLAQTSEFVRISWLLCRCRRVARDSPVLVASGRTEAMLWNRLKLLWIFFGCWVSVY
jgi:hypothetical protein